MSRNLFLRVVEGMEKGDSSRGRIVMENFLFFPLHKCMAALRMIAYGKATDAIDAEIQMGETTVLNVATCELRWDFLKRRR